MVTQEQVSSQVALVAKQMLTLRYGDAFVAILACLLWVHLQMMPCATSTEWLMGPGMLGVLLAILPLLVLNGDSPLGQ